MTWYEQFATTLLGRLQASPYTQKSKFLSSVQTMTQNFLIQQNKQRETFPVPTITSPAVTAAGDRLRRRLGGTGGRSGTLLTGGLLGPALTDKQGLRPI